MPKEIIISHPELNTDSRAGFCYTHPALPRRRFEELCANRGITSATHPTVCDLFAGTGGMAAIVCQHGWRRENFTYIDKYQPGQDLGEKGEGQWLFWDLWELGRVLTHQESLPKGVLAYQGKFDLVVSAYNWRVPPEWERTLIEFLAKNRNDSLIVPDEWDWSHLLSLDIPRPYPGPLSQSFFYNEK